MTASRGASRGRRHAKRARRWCKFEGTLEATRAALREHVGASADMKEVVAEMVQQVRLLDGLVRYRFGDSAELMGAWLSVRNVPDSVRTHGEPAPVVVKPAA